MRLVAARQVNQLCKATAAESVGDGGLTIGHEDGTISIYNRGGGLEFLWLNPGEQITAITGVDMNLLACFASGAVSLISPETGLVIAETTLPFPVSGVHVLEFHIVCWSRSEPRVLIIQRSNLDLWQSIDTESFPLAVVALSQGLSIICSSNVYLLKITPDRHFEPVEILKVSAPFIAATAINGRWLLARATTWSLFTFDSSKRRLVEEFTVDPPEAALLYKAVLTQLGAFILCGNGIMVYVRESNIQILEPPRPGRGMLTSDALIVWPDLKVSEAYAQGGEIKWRSHDVQVRLSPQKYLLGCDDPNVTAIYGEYRGTADGKVNDVAVLPGPVLYIDANTAQSSAGLIKLPLQDVNVLSSIPDAQLLRDHRVSVKAVDYDPKTSNWIGIQSHKWATLRPLSVSVPAPISTLLILEGHSTVEKVLAKLDNTPSTLAQFEDLAVTATSMHDYKLCAAAASVLDKIWTSKRVAELMRSAGPRSLQVLSSVLPYIEIQRTALLSIISLMADSDSRADREAVLWVYEHKPDLVEDLPIPFAALRGLTEDSVSRFAQIIARSSSSKLLRDAASLMSSSGDATMPADEVVNNTAEYNVMKVLLAALSSPGPPEFPPSDEALAELVAFVVPAVHLRVVGAKKILSKLLSLNVVQYHQGTQRLLVPTPSERANQAALVFEFADRPHEPLSLMRANSQTIASPLLFNADGKSVHALVPKGRLIWQFGGTLRTLFRSKQPIEPLFERALNRQ